MIAEPAVPPDREDEPYVGPRPFRMQDSNKLFGRDEETAELLSLIGAAPLVILYAQSGAGKTSLLNAKIYPGLKARPWEVIGPLRFSGTETPSGLRSSENIFVYKALLSGSLIASSRWWRLGGVSLTKYLEQRKKLEIQPGLRMPRVVIFDQFEEMFTLHADRWKDRRGFFDDVAEALGRDPQLRIVIAMREEYLGSVNAHSADISPRLVARFRLERLRRDAVLEAISLPLELTPVRFRKGADVRLADKLLRLVRPDSQMPVEDEFVEPLHLQLVCQQIWRRLPAGQNLIGDELVDVAGDVEEALYRYYENVLARVLGSNNEEVQSALSAGNVTEGVLRMWFERHLITDDGNRSIAYRTANTTNGLSNKIVEAIEREYLIRSEPRGGGIWYEVSHDRFLQPILRSNQNWRRQNDRDNRGGALEERAAQWACQEKPDDLLLTGVELRAIRLWLATPEAKDLGLSKAAEEFVQRSEDAYRTVTAQRDKLKIAVLVLLVIAAAGAVALVMRGKRAAEEARTLAHIEISEAMTAEGRPIEGLSWGLRAAAVGNMPDGSANALRGSLTALGGAEWVERPKAPFASMQVSSDGSVLVTQSPQEICAWDAQRGLLRWPCKAPPQDELWTSVSITPGGTWIFAQWLSDNSRGWGVPFRSIVWSTKHGGEDSFLTRELDRYSLFSPDDRWLLSRGSGGGGLKLTDLRSRGHCIIPSSFGGRFVSAGGTLYGTLGPDLKWKFWSSSCRQIGATELMLHPSAVSDAEDKVIAAQEGRTSAVVLDRTGRLVARFNASREIDSIALSPDGKRLAIVSDAIAVYDVPTKSKVDSHRRHRGRLSYGSGSVYATATARKESTSVAITNVFSGRTIGRLIPVTNVQKITVDQDQKRLFVLANGIVRIYDLTQTPKYEQMSLSALQRSACHALRNQPEHSQVRSACR
jgi:WD40 repeat protein